MTEGTRASDETLRKLRSVSTATISAVLRKHGYEQMFMEDVAPLRPDLRMAGHAVTLRYIAARPDLDPSGEVDNRTNKQRIAIQSVGQGDVLVIEARGDTRAGTLGNILATRVQQLGGEGIVTDGAYRDTPEIVEIDLPTYSRAQHPNLSASIHFPADVNVPITCGGIAVLPGDIIVGDAEGVIVVPLAIADAVSAESYEQEEREAFILEKVQAGRELQGIYPPNEAALAEFEEWRRARRV
jgi:regulator of RNase E activity RraA